MLKTKKISLLVGIILILLVATTGLTEGASNGEGVTTSQENTQAGEILSSLAISHTFLGLDERGEDIGEDSLLVADPSRGVQQTLVSDKLFGDRGPTGGNFSTYFDNLFNLALIIGATLAVLMIATSGLQYMTTDAVSGKTEGKERIQRAILGLLMLLAVGLFFSTVNPNILNINLSLSKVKTESPGNGDQAARELRRIRNLREAGIIKSCGGTSTISCAEMRQICIQTRGQLRDQPGGANSMACYVDSAAFDKAISLFKQNAEKARLLKLLSEEGCTSENYLQLSACTASSIQKYKYIVRNPKLSSDGEFIFSLFPEDQAGNCKNIAKKLEEKENDSRIKCSLVKANEGGGILVPSLADASKKVRLLFEPSLTNLKLFSDTKIKAQPPYKIGQKITIDFSFPGSEFQDLENDPLQGKTGEIIGVRTTSNGTVRYAIRFSDGTTTELGDKGLIPQ